MNFERGYIATSHTAYNTRHGYKCVPVKVTILPFRSSMQKRWVFPFLPSYHPLLPPLLIPATQRAINANASQSVSQSFIHIRLREVNQTNKKWTSTDWATISLHSVSRAACNLNRPSAVAPVSAAATRTFNKVSSNFGKLRRPTSAKISKEKHLCISLKKPPCQMRVLQYPMENMENMIQLVTNTKRYRPYVKLGAKSALPIKIFQKSMPH